MSKKRGEKSSADFQNSSVFYEELLMMRAQHLVSQLMDNQNVSQVELANQLGISKAEVCRLLDVDRNLTLRTFAKICFSLGFEIQPYAQPIAKQSEIQGYSYNQATYEIPKPSKIEGTAVEEDSKWKAA